MDMDTGHKNETYTRDMANPKKLGYGDTKKFWHKYGRIYIYDIYIRIKTDICLDMFSKL